jgi:CheY-like chemotaxis protein
MLGGDIQVQSQLGQGSTFTVTIATGPLTGVPLVNYSQDAQPVQENERRSLAGAGPQLRGRILLAEDGPDNQRLIAFHLRRAGAEVSVAENGQVAVDLFQAAQAEGQPFGLIVMDMQMPVLDGYQATRRLRDQGCRLPIIALTAHAMTGELQKCLAAGCDYYATKPIDRHKLIKLVATCLEQGNSEMVSGNPRSRAAFQAVRPDLDGPDARPSPQPNDQGEVPFISKGD